MVILHIAPNAPYNEGWGYQDNILPKYHAKLGHDVTLVITNTTHKDGKVVETKCEDYISDNGFRVIRRPTVKKYPGKIGGMLKAMQVEDLLEEIKPDFVFFHGLVSNTILQVVKYKKNSNKKVTIVMDNHLDYQIGNLHEKGFYNFLLRNFRRMIYKRSDKYVSRVYGVTPWRVEYAHKIFGVPMNKLDTLIMGADDDEVHFEKAGEIRKAIRAEYQISDEDFLLVTGGKLDKNKGVLPLMEAVCNTQGVKLLIFGKVLEDIKEEFDRILQSTDNIIYIGWIDSNKVYDYFFAADVAFFPGQHSVLWEQACASKLPSVFRQWPGMDHVDNGGNSAFVSEISKDTIRDEIEKLKWTDEYKEMLKQAKSEKTDIYLYSAIAKKSLEACETEGQ